MKKQTKLVAVLSTASLLAIGASMTSFAATGWVEENGTWVYYDRNEERVTDQWARSGNGWYYLDENGEMATDRLIEDGDNHYYVDTNGVMVTNQWVAIDNEDAGEDDEPDHYWYYFQANGRAMTNGNNDRVALKTINGKKYAFDDEGRMLFGWVKEDDPERRDNTDGDAFLEGDYYFGDSDDGAMTTGWLQLDVTYEEATENEYNYIAPVFHEDEEQTRWFYFMSNGKKVKADEGEDQKERTINGRRYAFDQYGAMIAEWSLDTDEVSDASRSQGNYSDFDGATSSVIEDRASANTAHAKYTHEWRYFSDVEDGARVSRGWFKVVAAEYLDETRYDDDEESWYYADGGGNLYAGEFKTINGRRFAFRNDGRCLFGLKFIREDDDALDVVAEDDDVYNFDNEDDFDLHAPQLEAMGYKCYYFGESGDAPTDGSMRTGRTNVPIDGDNYTFYFETSGGNKGAGVTGEEDDRYYQSGKLLAAGSDERIQVVVREKVKTVYGEDHEAGKTVYSYRLLDDVDAFLDDVRSKYGQRSVWNVPVGNYGEQAMDEVFSNVDNMNQDADELDELYVFYPKQEEGEPALEDNDNIALDEKEYFLVNTSGRVVDKESRSRDGNDYYFVTNDDGAICAIYLED